MRLTLKHTAYNAHSIVAAAACFLIGSLFAHPAVALDMNSDHPIEISSDSAEIDDLSGEAIYQGDVSVSQGATTLTADTVMVSAPDKSLKRIVASGKPSQFKQSTPTETGTEQTEGKADSITYNAEDQTITFKGNAKVLQNNNSFEGSSIVYDLQARAIKAKSDPKENKRVVIIYQPTAKDSSREPTTSDAPLSSPSEPITQDTNAE